jgi:hypothetical protein
MVKFLSWGTNMEREVEDTISVLIQLDGKRGHHPCTVTILWGSLPSRVRRVVGWWKPLQYACRQLAACEKVEELEAGITVDMQMLMEQAFTERRPTSNSRSSRNICGGIMRRAVMSFKVVLVAGQ